MIHKTFLVLNFLGSEWIIVILFALSIITVWIVLKRYVEIRRLTLASTNFWNEYGEKWLKTADYSSWQSQLETIQNNYSCLESETLELIFQAKKTHEIDVKNIISAFLGQKRLKLGKLIGILGTIGANAPFIGLLGTVIGIVRSFNQISVQGLGSGIQSIGSGIAEALVATAIGLFVAVPAVIFFNFFQKQILVLIQRAENLSELILSLKK